MGDDPDPIHVIHTELTLRKLLEHLNTRQRQGFLEDGATEYQARMQLWKGEGKTREWEEWLDDGKHIVKIAYLFVKLAKRRRQLQSRHRNPLIDRIIRERERIQL